MKAHLVDGPHHGTTLYVDSNSSEVVVPVMLGFNPDTPNAKYRLVHITEIETAIYAFVRNTQ